MLYVFKVNNDDIRMTSTEFVSYWELSTHPAYEFSVFDVDFEHVFEFA